MRKQKQVEGKKRSCLSGDPLIADTKKTIDWCLGTNQSLPLFSNLYH